MLEKSVHEFQKLKNKIVIPPHARPIILMNSQNTEIKYLVELFN